MSLKSFLISLVSGQPENDTEVFWITMIVLCFFGAVCGWAGYLYGMGK